MKKRRSKEELENLKNVAKFLFTKKSVTTQKELSERVGVSENIKMKKRRSKEELENLKNVAKILFTKEGVTTQKELSERVGVSENTISKWINDEKWVDYKKNFLLTREERMNDLLNELTAIQELIKSTPPYYAGANIADIRRKLIKDIKDLETKASKSETIHALMALIKFVRPENITEAKTITKWADIYIKSLLK